MGLTPNILHVRCQPHKVITELLKENIVADDFSLGNIGIDSNGVPPLIDLGLLSYGKREIKIFQLNPENAEVFNLTRPDDLQWDGTLPEKPTVASSIADSSYSIMFQGTPKDEYIYDLVLNAHYHDSEEFLNLLKNPPQDVSLDQSELSKLMSSALLGGLSVEVLEDLNDKGAVITTDYWELPRAINSDFKVSEGWSKSKEEFFNKIVKNNSFEAVDYVLNNLEIDINYVDWTGRSALVYAAEISGPESEITNRIAREYKEQNNSQETTQEIILRQSIKYLAFENGYSGGEAEGRVNEIKNYLREQGYELDRYLSSDTESIIFGDKNGEAIKFYFNPLIYPPEVLSSKYSLSPKKVIHSDRLDLDISFGAQMPVTTLERADLSEKHKYYLFTKLYNALLDEGLVFRPSRYENIGINSDGVPYLISISAVKFDPEQASSLQRPGELKAEEVTWDGTWPEKENTPAQRMAQAEDEAKGILERKQVIIAEIDQEMKALGNLILTEAGDGQLNGSQKIFFNSLGNNLKSKLTENVESLSLEDLGMFKNMIVEGGKGSFNAKRHADPLNPDPLITPQNAERFNASFDKLGGTMSRFSGT